MWIVVQNTAGIMIAKTLELSQLLASWFCIYDWWPWYGVRSILRTITWYPWYRFTAVTAAFGMVAGTILSAPVGERGIKMHKVKTPYENPD